MALDLILSALTLSELFLSLYFSWLFTFLFLAGSLCKELFRISSTTTHRQESLFNGHKLARWAGGSQTSHVAGSQANYVFVR
jgi:hypothetical protein